MTSAPPPPRRSVSLRRKLATAIVLAALLPLVAATALSYAIARRALVEASEKRLELMLGEKTRQLQGNLDLVAANVQLFAQAPEVVEGLAGLTAAWAHLPEDLGWPAAGAKDAPAEALRRRDDAIRTLSQYHQTQSSTPQAGGGSDGWGVGSTLPADPSAQAAQVLFLTENPHPAGAKVLLERPGRADLAFGEAHARIHPHLGDLVRARRYDDLYLVDGGTGHVVYSVAKDLDFGANVREGPFAATGLGRAARRALESQGSDAVVAEDWTFYPGPGGRPAAFVAAPIRSGGRTVGALVLRLPNTRVNALFAPEPGVHPSTETLLVGPDGVLRTDTRFEPPGTALRKRVDSFAVQQALAGRSGVTDADDHRGIPSLVAYAPLDVYGLRFAVVRKVDEREALAPATRLLYGMGAITLALVGLALVGGLALSRTLARPIAEVTGRLQTTAQTLLSTAQEQQAGAAEAAAAVEETRQTFAGVLGAAQGLRGVGTQVLTSAEVSQRNAQTIGRRIQELSQNTAHIGEILSLVREIANRSDLLALNAALEGTKAGEAGRGFSLVATQMQRLAEEVMGSVKRIDGLTQDISRASAGAVLAAEEADKVAAQTTGSAQRIAEAVQTQQAATEQVSVAMNEIATVAQNSVDASRRIVAASNDLLGVSESLRRVVGS